MEFRVVWLCFIVNFSPSLQQGYLIIQEHCEKRMDVWHPNHRETQKLIIE